MTKPVNIHGTKRRSVTERLPARWELIDKDGNSAGVFTMLGDATFTARRLWPDQEQDEDRTGKGWDIQVVGMT